MDRIYLGIYYISIAGGVILAAWGIWSLLEKKSPNRSGESPVAMEGEVSRIAVLLLFLVAFFLRIYLLGVIPAGINQDEAMTVVNARAVLETGKDTVGNSFPAEFVAWGNGGQSVLLGYSMIPLIALFGDGLNVVRLVPVFYSMLGLLAFYLLSKRLLSPKSAFLVTLLAAFSPWHFMQSRWALDCNLMSHLWILGILCLVLALQDGRWYYGAAAVFGLSMYSYGISFYTISIYLVIGIIYLFIRKQITVKQMLLGIGIFLLVSLPIDFTMLVNTFHLPTIHLGPITAPLLSDQVRSQDILLFAFSWDQFLENVKALSKLLLGQYDGLWFNSNLFFGTIYLCSMPYALIGLVQVTHKAFKDTDRQTRSQWFLIWLYVTISLFSGVITKKVNANRMNFLYYGLLLLTGIGVFTIIKGSKARRNLIFSLYALNMAAFFFMYFTLWANTSGFFVSYGYAIQKAALVGKEKSSIVIEYNSPDVTRVLTLYEQKIPMSDYQSGAYLEKTSFYEDVSELKELRSDTAYVIRLKDQDAFADFANIDVYGAYAVVYE